MQKMPSQARVAKKHQDIYPNKRVTAHAVWSSEIFCPFLMHCFWHLHFFPKWPPSTKARGTFSWRCGSTLANHAYWYYEALGSSWKNCLFPMIRNIPPQNILPVLYLQVPPADSCNLGQLQFCWPGVGMRMQCRCLFPKERKPFGCAGHVWLGIWLLCPLTADLKHRKGWTWPPQSRDNFP